jgi:hypothetical protein
VPLDVRERRDLRLSLLHAALAEQREPGVARGRRHVKRPRLRDGHDPQPRGVMAATLRGRAEPGREPLVPRGDLVRARWPAADDLHRRYRATAPGKHRAPGDARGSIGG